MTSKEQTESLGRRLLACGHYHLHPGIRCASVGARAVLGASGRGLEWVMDGPPGHRGAGDFPDVTDEGTLGCIEHALLPAAWPGCAITVMRWTAHDGEVMADVYIQDYRLPCAERFSIGMVPLADALVAALEAAP